MLAEKNIYNNSAYRRLQAISQDDGKRMEYEARQKAIRNYNEGLLEAEERGEKRGILGTISSLWDFGHSIGVNGTPTSTGTRYWWKKHRMSQSGRSVSSSGEMSVS